MTDVHTIAKASRMPMLVSSAASAIGRKPAIRPEPMPTIHVTRTGTRCLESTLANHLGSSPSRDIENHTRVTANINVNITVAIPRIAPTEITVAMPGNPTSAKACANADSESSSL